MPNKKASNKSKKSKPRVAANSQNKRAGNAQRAKKRGKVAKQVGSTMTPTSATNTGRKKAERTATKGVDPASAKRPSAKAPVNIKAYFVDVDSEHDGQRIDNFLVTHLKGVPKTHIYRIIRKGEVRVNKGRVKQTTRLRQGDSIRIPPIRLAESSSADIDGARYEFLKKAILFEDDSLLIINKPSGMAVHAGSGIKVGVIEALRALRNDIKYLELVHRLDRETSGCLVLAKKSSALKSLHEDFKTNSLKNKRLDKRYLALVQGQWRFGQRRITKALNTDARKHGERHVVVDENGSYASSIAKPVCVSMTASLVEVKLLTGRTHQVRVHLQSEGHPLAGDSRYGDPDFNRALKDVKLGRLFLHASQLSLVHPITAMPLTVVAPLPEDLLKVLDKLALSYEAQSQPS